MIIVKENRVKAPIPDNDKKGLVSTIAVNQKGKIKDLRVKVNIAHPYVGDLHVELISPSGKSVVLHNRTKAGSKDLKVTYGKDVLESLLGTKANGNWQLKVKDVSSRDNGILTSWRIRLSNDTSKAPSEINIPDNDDKGLESVQEARYSGLVTDMKLNVDVEHSYIGDLHVALVAPSGKTVVVHDRKGGSKKNIKETYGKDVLADMIGEKTLGKWKLVLKDFSPRDKGVLKAWKLNMKFQSIDDLKKVEGIGPKIEQILNKAGISSFSRLSATSARKVKEVLEAAGDRYKMHDPTTWGEQARMAAAGDWKKLEKWQDELDGGRVV